MTPVNSGGVACCIQVRATGGSPGLGGCGVANIIKSVLVELPGYRFSVGVVVFGCQGFFLLIKGTTSSKERRRTRARTATARTTGGDSMTTCQAHPCGAVDGESGVGGGEFCRSQFISGKWAMASASRRKAYSTSATTRLLPTSDTLFVLIHSPTGDNTTRSRKLSRFVPLLFRMKSSTLYSAGPHQSSTWPPHPFIKAMVKKPSFSNTGELSASCSRLATCWAATHSLNSSLVASDMAVRYFGTKAPPGPGTKPLLSMIRRSAPRKVWPTVRSGRSKVGASSELGRKAEASRIS